jgi:bisphosphoglycerate-dependent phosphoglycerate mutase
MFLLFCFVSICFVQYRTVLLDLVSATVSFQLFIQRMYGALTGKSKQMVANEYGEAQLKVSSM